MRISETGVAMMDYFIECFGGRTETGVAT